MSFRVELFIWSCWINAAFSFAMMALVLFSRPLNKTKFLWMGSCFMVGAWSASLAIMSLTRDYSTAFKGTLAVTGISIWIPVFLYHTVQSLLNRKTTKSLTLVYGAGLVLSILNLAGHLNGVRPIADFYFYTSAKPLYFLFPIFLYATFISLGVQLWKAAKKAPPIQKKQLLFLLVGVELGLLGGQTTYPMVYGVEIFPWGTFFVPVYVLTVGYSMMKHQLMDFKMAVKKLSLSLTIYICLGILVAPFVYPPVEKILTRAPEIRFPLFTLIFVYTLVIAFGGMVYAFLVQRSFWLKSNMTMGLVHELKSPLANIRGALEIMHSEKGAEGKTYLSLLDKNTSRLEYFVSDLLSLAAIQEDSFQLNITSFDLVDMLTNVIDNYQPLAESKGMKIVLEAQAPIQFTGDQEKMRQVFSNLISNALKFSDEGQIEVKVEKSVQNLSISVQDHGVGIAPQDLPKVFDRFYQAKSSSKGAGIGLAIAKAWVEAHGGKIWAESEGVGRGARIRLYF